MISKVLEKVARGEVLSTMEMQRFKSWGDTTESNNAYVSGLQTGVSDLDVNEITMNASYPKTMPTNLGYVGSFSDTQSIADSTWTLVSLATGAQPFAKKGSTNEFFEWDSTNYRMIVKKQASFIMSVGVKWADDSTGERRIAIDVLDKDDGALGTYNLARVPAAGLSYLRVVNWVDYKYGSSTNVGDYFEVWVYQTSGGALDLDGCQFSIGRFE